MEIKTIQTNLCFVLIGRIQVYKSDHSGWFVSLVKLGGMVSFLKIFLSLVWVFMVYMVVSTSLESSLFKEWDYLGSIPWMRATLWDFYANVLVIYLWVLYRERNVASKILWAILFFTLGSIGTIGYLLVQLFGLKENEGVDVILKSKPARA